MNATTQVVIDWVPLVLILMVFYAVMATSIRSLFMKPVSNEYKVLFWGAANNQQFEVLVEGHAHAQHLINTVNLHTVKHVVLLVNDNPVYTLDSRGVWTEI